MPLGWGLEAAGLWGPVGEGQDKAGLHLELKKFFFKIFFFRAISGSHEDWENTEIYHYPHTPLPPPLPTINIFHQSDTLVTTEERTYSDTSLSPRVHSLHWGSPLVFYTLRV